VLWVATFPVIADLRHFAIGRYWTVLVFEHLPVSETAPTEDPEIPIASLIFRPFPHPTFALSTNRYPGPELFFN